VALELEPKRKGSQSSLAPARARSAHSPRSPPGSLLIFDPSPSRYQPYRPPIDGEACQRIPAHHRPGTVGPAAYARCVIDCAAAPEPVETWRPVVGFAGLYDVSDRGRIRSLPRMTPHAGVRGGGLRALFLRGSKNRAYFHVRLWRDGEAITCSVAALVLEAFVGPRPAGQVARHGIGGPQDNRWPENLCWGTPAENAADKFRHGTQQRGERCYNAKLTAAAAVDIRRRWLAGESQTSIATYYGVSRAVVYKIVHNLAYPMPGPVHHLPPQVCAQLGERRGGAKLTWVIVDECRARHACGESGRALAAEFGVSQSTMWQVLAGQTWTTPENKAA
jgi:hypothetical protein